MLYNEFKNLCSTIYLNKGDHVDQFPEFELCVRDLYSQYHDKPLYTEPVQETLYDDLELIDICLGLFKLAQ